MKLPSWLLLLWGWIVQRRLVVTLIVLLVALIATIWWCGWDWLSTVWWCSWKWLRTGSRDFESGSTTIRNVGLVVGGGIAIWVAYRRSVIAQRGLLNERFQKGAEMLGSEVLSVRLGGIYALDRLVSEYPDIFHLQVMKLFAAFVVDRTRAQTAEQIGTITDSATSECEEPSKPSPASFGEVSDEIDLFFAADREVGPVPGLAKDVEEVMRLISKRDEKRIALESKEEIRMNLADASLPGLIFHEADFSKFDFTKADLRRVRGWEARLTKAVLPGADLSGANLHGADFRDADMRRVNLTAARLRGADLKNANLGLVDLASQNLWKGATFPSKLEGARLEGADLSGANLVHADMRGASLAGTNLTATSLSGAKGLTQDQLDQACADPDNPPKLDRAHDAKTGKPLEWHGQPCRN